MIILDSREYYTQQILNNREQIEGSQNWLYEYPTGFGARCHYYQGGFSVEVLDINPGVIDYARDYLIKDFEEEGKYDAYDKMFEIENAWNNMVSGEDFSDEEWEVFLSEGFLGILAKRCPELQQNEVFNFYVRIDKMVRDLEKSFKGKPYSEILTEIQAKLTDENSNDYKIWQAIQGLYTKDFMWVSDTETGKGGQRDDYVHYLELEERSLDNSLLEQKEDELSSLEAEAKRISEAENLIDQQTPGQNIGEE